VRVRFIALPGDAGPLGVLCPVCERPMDDSGCRIGEHRVRRDPEQTRGIAQITEVFCTGTPTMPAGACPSCTEEP
jgi:hypothetical protein